MRCSSKKKADSRLKCVHLRLDAVRFLQTMSSCTTEVSQLLRLAGKCGAGLDALAASRSHGCEGPSSNLD